MNGWGVRGAVRRVGVPAGVLALAVVASLAATPAPAATPARVVRPKTTLAAVSQQVMCVACGIPLVVAESAEANRERAFITPLIAKGETLAQIKSALVQQYGQRVIAQPPGSGFGLVAYIVPLALGAAVIAALALLLPKWRRRGRAQFAAAGAPTVTAADAARLEAELRKFDG